MEKYIIKVNGKEYEVEVEKVGSVQQASPAAPAAAAPAPVAPAPAPKAPAASVQDGVRLEAGAAGKVFRIVKKAGESVSKGDTVIILEAMKMEIPMVSTADGTVKEITVSEGQPVEAGDLLAVIG
ncbi:MAG: biotin/lipoyl-binding protein [Firmicutes bacterium]|nr:biotin/lipoyl-binding protein [Bacillota bacterium]MBQ1631043.1 biotin/lipoyl-binding protein [Bacillota bacterium]